MSERIDYPPRTRAAIDEWMERKDKGAISYTEIPRRTQVITNQDMSAICPPSFTERRKG